MYLRTRRKFTIKSSEFGNHVTTSGVPRDPTRPFNIVTLRIGPKSLSMIVEAAARAADVPLPLGIVPSLLNSPTTSQTCKWIRNGENTEQVKGTRGDEVVPDSEEERLMCVDQIYYD